MTKSNKINILRADHVVGLSQASVEINIGSAILLLGVRALPSTVSGQNDICRYVNTMSYFTE